MAAQILFAQGVVEESVPDIRVTRGKSGNSGMAVFVFEDPKILAAENTSDVTGMYLVSDDLEIITRDVKVKFYDGKARVVEATLVMNSLDEWNGFMKFMEQYAEEAGLDLQRKS